jgi:hypothetical protein
MSNAPVGSEFPGMPTDTAADQTWASKYPELRKVATGLGILYATIVIGILLGMGTVLAMIILKPQIPPKTLSIGIAIASLALYGFNVVGTLLCLATPRESGGKNLIQSSVVFMLLSASISLAGFIIGPLSSTLSAISMPAWTLSTLLFVIYLRKLALFLNSPKLTRAGTRLIVAEIVFGALSLGNFYFVMNTIGPGRQVQRPAMENYAIPMVIVGLATFICALYVLIAYSNLLRNLRKRIYSNDLDLQ